MLDKVLCDYLEAVLGTDNRIDVRSFTLEVLLFILRLVFRQLGNFIVDHWTEIFVKWCSGETDKGGVWQGIAKVLGETVGNLAGFTIDPGPEAVLAAVRFVGDHDDVPPVSQDRVVGPGAPGRKFLNRREDRAAGWANQDLL